MKLKKKYNLMSILHPYLRYLLHHLYLLLHLGPRCLLRLLRLHYHLKQYRSPLANTLAPAHKYFANKLFVILLHHLYHLYLRFLLRLLYHQFLLYRLRRRLRHQRFYHLNLQ
jgi:hypothetical protein